MEVKIKILIVLSIILVLFKIGNYIFKKKFKKIYHSLSEDERYNYLLNLDNTNRFILLKDLRNNILDDSYYVAFHATFDNSINDQIILEIYWFIKKITKDKKFPLSIEDNIELYLGNFEKNELKELLFLGLNKITRLSFMNDHNEVIAKEGMEIGTIEDLIVYLNEMYENGYIKFADKKNLDFLAFKLKGFR